ncbi:hypothetical protein ACROYT_G036564 [Oculina patagonica]
MSMQPFWITVCSLVQVTDWKHLISGEDMLKKVPPFWIAVISSWTLAHVDNGNFLELNTDWKEMHPFQIAVIQARLWRKLTLETYI